MAHLIYLINLLLQVQVKLARVIITMLQVQEIIKVQPLVDSLDHGVHKVDQPPKEDHGEITEDHKDHLGDNNQDQQEYLKKVKL